MGRQNVVTKRKTPDFKLTGNKRRYETNDEVLGHMEDTITRIEQNDLNSAKEHLEAGKKILLKQQKLIRIADREENGWEVAKHYMSDDLASDTDDEKALKRARKEALASIIKKKEKQHRDFRKSKNGRSGFTNRERFTQKTFDRPFHNKKHDICFKCGCEGHWQNNCYSTSRK